MITTLLIRRFVRNAQDVEQPAVRKAYGTLSSMVGIVCNLLLFGLKYTMGTLSGSIAILSDAFNNLSDCASCLVTFFGYKAAAKPADRDHPFGHGRMEYLTSMLVAALILLMGFELLRDSIGKILHPEEITFRWVVLAALLCSIGVKLWMAAFNHRLGTIIHSSVLLATAKDSRNDVIATSATVLSLVLSCFTSLPVDGVAGLLVSFFILKAGLDIIRDTVDDLLGRPADPETVQSLRQIITAHDKILDIHDLILHNYGPSHRIGSCHVEVRSDENFVEIHDLVDQIEKQILETLHISMTIHMDPIETDNAVINDYKAIVRGILADLDHRLTFHDFRMVSGASCSNLIFDVVLPFGYDDKTSQLQHDIDQALQAVNPRLHTVITFEHSLVDDGLHYG